jgi:hypothetical protein
VTPATPYLFVEIWVPKRAPYNHSVHGWPTIIGDFVKPLVAAHPDMLVWFLQEGPHWQLCFGPSGSLDCALAIKTLEYMRRTMVVIAKERGFHIKRYIRGSTFGGALAGSRWMPAKKQKRPEEQQRSFLLARACHAVCAVYMDTLVRKGNHWVVESPQCKKQNPHGNIFESFMHLCANLSGAKFDVQLKVRTRWMHGDWQEAKAVCHI